MGRACGMCGGEEKCIEHFGRETRGGLLGRPKSRWVGSIKIEIKEIEWGIALD
jgi:hypothetical protein